MIGLCISAVSTYVVYLVRTCFSVCNHMMERKLWVGCYVRQPVPDAHPQTNTTKINMGLKTDRPMIFCRHGNWGLS